VKRSVLLLFGGRSQLGLCKYAGLIRRVKEIIHFGFSGYSNSRVAGNLEMA
jgi:hypothetical protein